jgi:hypothetical protein
MSTPAAENPIASAGDAEHAIANLNTTMDRLEATVAEETTRVRAGNLRAARELDDAKSELARAYTVQIERVKAASDIIARALPEAVATLRARHEAFQSLLQTNMTVLATAHAVSEGIIRGVWGELARKQTPATYGASGRTNAPNPKASQPLALSRKL